MTPLLALCLAAATAIVPAAASAQSSDWPNKPVRVVVPYAAGGAADTLGRLFADALGANLGKQFYVDNRPGGGSVIGTEVVAKSPPDGYTFTLSGMSTHVLAPAMNKNASFDPVKDFTHIAYFGGAPNVFVLHPSFGAKTFAEFMAKAKAEKEGVQYVSPGVGSVGNLVAEYFAAKEKIKLTHVAYRGGSQALLDLVAGHVKVGMMSLSTALQHVKQGRLIPIGISSAERLPDLPDVPTLKELGSPDLVATTWWSFSGPAGVPAEIVQKLNAEINKAMDSAQVQKQLAQDGVQAKKMTPAEVTAFVQAEVGKWAPFVKSVLPAN
jgi:tripartite-type tricarboxylate transporter receptor subunit TctC